MTRLRVPICQLCEKALLPGLNTFTGILQLWHFQVHVLSQNQFSWISRPIESGKKKTQRELILKAVKISGPIIRFLQATSKNNFIQVIRNNLCQKRASLSSHAAQLPCPFPFSSWPSRSCRLDLSRRSWTRKSRRSCASRAGIEKNLGRNLVKNFQNNLANLFGFYTIIDSLWSPSSIDSHHHPAIYWAK